MKMRSIKEQLLSNSYEYLRTLPNFYKIEDELKEFEKVLFEQADNGVLEVYVQINPWPYNSNPMLDKSNGTYRTKEITLSVLLVYCEMAGLFCQKVDTDIYSVSWIRVVEH